jgi:hypothetical protein
MQLERVIIQKDPNIYSAFPDLLRLKNGDLVVVFRETDFRGWATHIDPSSRIVLMRSKDEGRTWPVENKVVIDASAGNYEINIGALTEFEDELLVNNHRWRIFPLSAEAEVKTWEGKRVVIRRDFLDFVSVMDGVYFHRSPDGGQTWGKPERVAFPPYECFIHTGMNGAIGVSDGSFLLPLCGRGRLEGSDEVFLLRSRDGGKCWGEPTLVARDPEGRVSFHEPAVARLKSGKMLAMLRTAGADGYLYQTVSRDEGKTWEGLHNTGIWGHPAHLIQLKSGRVLCTYGHRREPFGIRARLSEDEGETWGKETAIRDDGLHWDLGYPASVQLEDERILSVYYFHDVPLPFEREKYSPGKQSEGATLFHDAPGIRFIEGTFWREEQAI